MLFRSETCDIDDIDDRDGGLAVIVDGHPVAGGGVRARPEEVDEVTVAVTHDRVDVLRAELHAVERCLDLGSVGVRGFGPVRGVVERVVDGHVDTFLGVQRLVVW